MKVKVKRKIHPIMPDEIRIINIGVDAIQEVLFENLMDHVSDYFDVPNKVDDDKICLMQWDSDSGCLTYAIMPINYALEGKELNYDYIRKRIGLTTNSLFQPHRYRRLRISPKIFM